MCSNQVCSNLRYDSANCGGCFNQCPPGMVCAPLRDGGVYCGCPTPGAITVGSACVDLPTDPSNCGQIGYACDPEADCQQGECICPDGTVQPMGGFCPVVDGGLLDGGVPDAGLLDDGGVDAGDAGDGGDGG